jgi:hypothetical protein
LLKMLWRLGVFDRSSIANTKRWFYTYLNPV